MSSESDHQLPSIIVPHEHPFLDSKEPIDLQKVAQFLLNCDENCCAVRIWHPKMVQRSYGKEKRFFCPFPIITFFGNGWEINMNAMREKLAAYRNELIDCIKNPPQEGSHNATHKTVLNQYPDLPLRRNCNIGINDGTTLYVATIETEAMAKNLFISNTDRRRFFKLSFDVTEYLGPTSLFPARYIGKFESSEVRVVSKPPKKQNTRAPDTALVCLKSGMQVALFNRSRSQSVATRYLYVEDPNFVVRPDRWSSFYIYAVNPEHNYAIGNTFSVNDGFIHYGTVVRLVDVVTGISSPNLILRRMEKDYVAVTPNETTEHVAMLQKVAFQFCDTASSYWALLGNFIVQKETNILSHDTHSPNDAITWMITNCEMIEFKYFEAMGPTSKPITPIPVILTAQLEGVKENNAIIELCGSNFTSEHAVYFGLCSSQIISCNFAYIRCHVPSFADVMAFSSMGVQVTKESGEIQVPVSLIRNDGVVYPTNVSFLYNNYSVGEIGKIVVRN